MSGALLGQPYGLTYEIIDKKLKVLPPKSMEELGKAHSLHCTVRVLKSHDASPDDTDATNEYINDGNVVQPLTSMEIEALKKSGLHASVCILLPNLSKYGDLREQ